MKTTAWAAVAALAILTSCTNGQPGPAPNSASNPISDAITSAEPTATPLPALPPAPLSPPAEAEVVARTTPVQPPRTRSAPPKPQAAPVARCDSNYTGACLPIASDVDCEGGTGNGPAYVRGPVQVVGNDHYGLDRDGDGIGCDK